MSNGSPAIPRPLAFARMHDRSWFQESLDDTLITPEFSAVYSRRRRRHSLCECQKLGDYSTVATQALPLGQFCLLVLYVGTRLLLPSFTAKSKAKIILNAPVFLNRDAVTKSMTGLAWKDGGAHIVAQTLHRDVVLLRKCGICVPAQNRHYLPPPRQIPSGSDSPGCFRSYLPRDRSMCNGIVPAVGWTGYSHTHRRINVGAVVGQRRSALPADHASKHRGMLSRRFPNGRGLCVNGRFLGRSRAFGLRRNPVGAVVRHRRRTLASDPPQKHHDIPARRFLHC